MPEPQQRGETAYHTRGAEDPTGTLRIAKVIQEMAANFVNTYGEESVFSEEFKTALQAALKSVRDTELLQRVAEKFKAEKLEQADTDGDGVVTEREAMNRVVEIFEELGMPDQAEYFRQSRRADS